MEMKRKTYLILIWSITLCVIVCSSTITFIKSKEIFTKVWNDVRNELEESFDFDFKFMSKNNDCGREYPMSETRPKTCKLKLIDLKNEFIKREIIRRINNES